MIGLTGGIACGKSTVSNRFRELGVPVIDADIIAFQALQKGSSAYARVLRAFKEYPELVLPSGDINRPYLRKLVFSDKSLNRKLKQSTHWAIGLEILRQVLLYGLWRGSDVVILDAPLLYESRADLLCKRVIAVHCEEETQIARSLLRRGWNNPAPVSTSILLLHATLSFLSYCSKDASPSPFPPSPLPPLPP